MYITKRTKRKIAYVLKIASWIFLWEFAFPGHIAAYEIQREPVDTQFTADSEFVESASAYRLPVNSNKPREEAQRTIYLSISAYSSTRDQTDGDPFTTASGTRVHDGTVASNFLPFGTRIRIPEYYGDKIFVVEDRMSARYRYKADIWMESRADALQWGVRYTKLEVL